MPASNEQNQRTEKVLAHPPTYDEALKKHNQKLVVALYVFVTATLMCVLYICTFLQVAKNGPAAWQAFDTALASVLASALCTFVLSRPRLFRPDDNFDENMRQFMDLQRRLLLAVQNTDDSINAVLPGKVEAVNVINQWMGNLARDENIQIAATMMQDDLFDKAGLMKAKGRNNNLKIQMVLLKPGCDATRQRARELGTTVEHIDIEIAMTANNMKKWCQELGMTHQLEIRYLDSIPGLYLVICGQKALVGFFCQCQLATSGPLLVIDPVTKSAAAPAGFASNLGSLVHAEFEKVWEVAKSESEWAELAAKQAQK